MNTVLVIMIYVNGWVPQYASVFPTAAACIAKAQTFKGSDNNIFYPKAVCLPQAVK